MAHFITFLNDADTYSFLGGSFVVAATEEESDSITLGDKPSQVVEGIDEKRIFDLSNPSHLRQLADLLEAG